MPIRKSTKKKVAAKTKAASRKKAAPAKKFSATHHASPARLPMRERLDRALAALKKTARRAPEIGIILGSGLGPLAQMVKVEAEIATADVPHYPASTVLGHEGRFIFGTLAGRRVVLLKGRIHRYEGYTLDEVVMPVRLMALLGAKTVLVTNAAGGINRSFQAGDIMLIEDHLNLQGSSPLEGPNLQDLGERFPDMSAAYSCRLRELAIETAGALGITLRRGVYASLPGPQYETPAEIRMLAAIGADAVGMSTVPEVIALRHMNVEVLGFSLISNLAAGISPVPLSHDEVVAMGKKVEGDMSKLMTAVLERLPKGSS